MTPNTLSYLTLLFGLAAGFMLSVGLFGFAALLILVSSLCDALDGWVARLSNKASFGGAVLDSSVDRYVEFCILGGILVLFCDDHELFVIVLLALIGSFMVSYSTAKAEAMSVSPPRGSMRRSDRAVFLFVGTFCAALFSSSWALVVSTLIIAIFANVSAVQRLMYVAKNAGLKN